MQPTKWFDRQFDFSATQNIFPSILERLIGTTARLKEKISHIPAELLTKRVDDKWTIKEHIGHLADLEPLWQGRFEDIKNNQTELRATDLQNRKTTEAGHNDKSVDELIEQFNKLRQETIQSLENIDETTVFKSALHPRLKTPMRTMDHFLFVAEHDDHHLAAISQLIKQLQTKYL